MKAIYLGVILTILSACSHTNPADLKIAEDKITDAKIAEQKLVEFECIQWSQNDSTVMKFLDLATVYLFEDDYKRAFVLYKHACTLPHELPEIYSYTGQLAAHFGDTTASIRYFSQEVTHDLKILASKKIPNCRKFGFAMALKDAYHLLGEEEESNQVFEKYPQLNHYKSLEHTPIRTTH